MNEKELWQAFQKTGRVADYLRYRGIDVFDDDPLPEEESDAVDNGCSDHPGKQQYR